MMVRRRGRRSRTGCSVFRSEAEAIQMANAIDLGLTAAVWTNDINRALRVAQSVQAGYVWVNDASRHFPGTVS